VVEDCPDRQRHDVGSHGRHREHQVEVQVNTCVLLVERLFWVRAEVPVSPFRLEHGFDSRIAKDDAGCEEAVEDAGGYLDCLGVNDRVVFLL
jgi:hypothetical protein